IPRKKVQNESLKKESEEEDSSKKMATSLILFEEVDIIFDEDVGFLNAIKTFMSTTKRPIILTTNDPSFSFIFDGCLEEIIFSPPSLIDVASYLQVVCLAENLRTDVRDFTTLLTANNCDIRQSILQLQFWVKSGGGYLKQKEKEVNDTEQIPCTEEITNPNTSKLNLPTCEVGFIDSLFGLRNILLSEDLFSFLKHEVATKEEWSKLTHLLTEFQMKNVDFIYSNLPFILPLPVNMVTEIPAHTTLAQSCLSNKTSDNDCREDANPVKNKQKKRRRNIALLDDSDLFENELDYSGLITLPSEPLGSHVEEKAGRLEPVRSNRKALTIETAAKPKSSACVSQCLNSLTEFVNNMSVLDYCFNRKIQQPKQSSKYEEFIWAKGKIKNGLSDEFSLDSLEHTDWWNTQSSSELKATVEALSFSKCFKNISEMMENNSERTLGKEECEGITLHISKEQANWYFHQSLADSRIQHNAQKRLEIINSVFSKAPLNFCNRQASIVEYLPVLRSICKSEKQKEKRRTKRRFLHYLEGIHLSFPREIMNRLGTGFP
uniref:ATPase family AAA domain containing 5 n=1 Tax=Salvator merianae TaxID=96440 RepID=A0A8D0BGV1_SALMN